MIYNIRVPYCSNLQLRLTVIETNHNEYYVTFEGHKTPLPLVGKGELMKRRENNIGIVIGSFDFPEICTAHNMFDLYIGGNDCNDKYFRIHRHFDKRLYKNCLIQTLNSIFKVPKLNTSKFKLL